VIDEGAIKAVVKNGRSLLPAGILEVKGEFGIGDSVKCVDAAGFEHARGLVAYSSRDVARIVGQPTNRIEPVLGYSNGAEVIHRDDLVVLTD
jgi:glutamate 5-kinase